MAIDVQTKPYGRRSTVLPDTLRSGHFRSADTEFIADDRYLYLLLMLDNFGIN